MADFLINTLLSTLFMGVVFWLAGGYERRGVSREQGREDITPAGDTGRE